MKKSIIKILTLVLSVVALICFAVACAPQGNNGHTHEYSNTYSYDNDYHWFECECGEDKGKTAHVIENGECVCGFKMATHTHVFEIDKSDADKHWKECLCGEKTQEQNHVFITKSNTLSHWQECSCGVKNNEENHDFATLGKDTIKHWYECECGQINSITPHDYVNNKCVCGQEKTTSSDDDSEHNASDWIIDIEPTCTEKGVRYKKCLDCGDVLTVEDMDIIDHSYDTVRYDYSSHWYECVCGKKLGVKTHSLNTTNLTRDPSINPCTSSWQSSLSECSECDYERKNYTQATGHNYSNIKVGLQPTETNSGYLVGDCQTCATNGFSGKEIKVVNLPCLSLHNITYYYEKTISEKNNDSCTLSYVYEYKGAKYAVKNEVLTHTTTIEDYTVSKYPFIKLSNVTADCGTLVNGTYVCEQCDLIVTVCLKIDHVYTNIRAGQLATETQKATLVGDCKNCDEKEVLLKELYVLSSEEITDHYTKERLDASEYYHEYVYTYKFEGKSYVVTNSFYENHYLEGYGYVKTLELNYEDVKNLRVIYFSGSPATCGAKANAIFICKGCDCAIDVTVARNHVEINVEITKPATESEDGEYTYYCAYEDCEYHTVKNTGIIPKED